MEGFPRSKREKEPISSAGKQKLQAIVVNISLRKNRQKIRKISLFSRKNQGFLRIFLYSTIIKEISAFSPDFNISTLYYNTRAYARANL